jgi:hypothetical protein
MAYYNLSRNQQEQLDRLEQWLSPSEYLKGEKELSLPSQIV